MSTPFKMKYNNSAFPFTDEKRKKVTSELEGNPDVSYRKVVKTSKKGKTTTKIRGEALSDKEYLYPASANIAPIDRPHKHIKRQPYIYKGKEGDVKIWSRKFKSKTDVSGNITKQKEKIVHDEGSKMTKRKQRVIKFGKHKGKVKSKTISYDKGKRTVSKTISDKIDTSPILNYKKGYYGL